MGSIDWKKACILAGAIIALVIGAGFATGQEIVQYYSAYGLQNILVILVFGITFLYYNYSFARVGRQEQYTVGNDIFKYYCGKYLGTFFDYYSSIFCYMSFFVMVGGAAATLHEGFGLPEWVGGVMLTAIVVIITTLGLKKLVDIIGVIGPLKITFFIVVGIICLCMDWGTVGEGLGIIEAGAFEGAAPGQTIERAGANWIESGLSYAGMTLLWFASFMALLGAKSKKQNINAGIVIGTVVICVAIGIISFAQIANINATDGIEYLWDAEIPNLILASKVWVNLPVVYAVVVFIGICATSVPLLYNPVARFSKEGTPRFKLLACVLGVVGMVIGLFIDYRTLVNVIYVINGYIGAVLLIFMIVRDVRDWLAKRKAKNAA